MFLKCVFIHRKIDVKQIFKWIKKGYYALQVYSWNQRKKSTFNSLPYFKKKKGGGGSIICEATQPDFPWLQYSTLVVIFGWLTADF